MVSKEDNVSGLFHSLLREIAEENISTFEVWINISSNYLVQRGQIRINRGILAFTIIMAVVAFLTLLAYQKQIFDSLNQIVSFFRELL